MKVLSSLTTPISSFLARSLFGVLEVALGLMASFVLLSQGPDEAFLIGTVLWLAAALAGYDVWQPIGQLVTLGMHAAWVLLLLSYGGYVFGFDSLESVLRFIGLGMASSWFLGSPTVSLLTRALLRPNREPYLAEALLLFRNRIPLLVMDFKQGLATSTGTPKESVRATFRRGYLVSVGLVAQIVSVSQWLHVASIIRRFDASRVGSFERVSLGSYLVIIGASLAVLVLIAL